MSRPRGGEPLVVWFDDDCGLCTAAVLALRNRVDPEVTFAANVGIDPALRARAADAIVVTDGASAWSGVEAVRRVVARTGPVGRVAAVALDLPGVRALAGVAYAAVARHRATISARLGLPSGCALDPSARRGTSGSARFPGTPGSAQPPGTSAS